MNNRSTPKSWLRYLNFKKAAPSPVRNMIYERALKCIPGSYKIWFKYLGERRVRAPLSLSDSAQLYFLSLCSPPL